MSRPPPAPRHGRLWPWAAVLVWAGLLFWQSSSSGQGGLFELLPAGSDKLAHGLAYLVFGGVAALATGSRSRGVLLAVLFGISDEIHQSYVPGRSPEIWDLVADSIGALIGAFIAPWLVRYPWRRRRDANVE